MKTLLVVIFFAPSFIYADCILDKTVYNEFFDGKVGVSGGIYYISSDG